MKHCKTLLHCALILGALTASSLSAAPLGTAFTYQGRLDQGGQPTTGLYQMTFWLYAASSGGSPLASNAIPVVGVTNGLFTTEVDFGANRFTGDERWLAITVATNGSSSFTLLQPRTRVAPTPNAVYASTAGTVTNGAIQAAQLGTIGAPPTSGQVLSFDGSSMVWQNPAAASGAWAVGGNNAVAGNFFGTLNNLPLEMRANSARALRLEPNIYSPNVIGGWNGNVADAGTVGVTIAGGGASTSFFGVGASNRVTDHFGSIGGGAYNLVGNTNGNFNDAYFATIAGGYHNAARGITAAVAGGSENRALGNDTFVGGGYQNTAQLNRDTVGGGGVNTAQGGSSTVAGGEMNSASAAYATIGGGFANQVTGAGSGTVGGGVGNIASGDSATVPGGSDNIAQGKHSFAAGRAAHAFHDGSFVWADRQGTIFSPTPYESTAANQFAVRASGGVRFETQFLQVSGAGNETAYIGGDGVGGEVHVGSLNPAVTKVALYNIPANQYMHLDMKSCTIYGGADLAEPFQISSAGIAKGSVVVIDPENPGKLKISTHAFDKRVAGIVSGANGIHPGIALKQEGALDQGENVALTGRVYVQADASFGAIEPGDLLTTSDTPGHAMKVLDHAKAQGAILGKAMSALNEGTGLVLVLVTLQ